MKPCDGTKIERLERNDWNSLWVTGSIGPLEDVDGLLQIEMTMHTYAQQILRSPWRWDVINQEFPYAIGDHRLTLDQREIVLDWLVKNGYAQDEIANDLISRARKVRGL